MYKIKIPKSYWGFDVSKVKALYGEDISYMGFFALKDKNGNWSDVPVDVFYQPNPKTELGHSNYFGLFFREGLPYITNAKSAFDSPMNAAIGADKYLYISTYRHNIVEFPGGFIDGGRDYTRLGGVTIPETIPIVVKGNSFFANNEKVERC